MSNIQLCPHQKKNILIEGIILQITGTQSKSMIKTKFLEEIPFDTEF